MRIVLAVLLLLASTLSATARSNRSGDYDYLVLALSWSPTYCASPAGANDNSQCAPGRRFAFVVHGLWPQYNKGWPQDCPTDESWVEENTIRSMMDIMPSKKLIIHEWKKHGTCAGVSQLSYFNAIRAIFAKVRIPARYLSPTADVITTPDQLVIDFVKTNKDLTSDMLSVQCGNSRDRARLSELRICLDKSGNFAACGANESRLCRATTLVMPQVR